MSVLYRPVVDPNPVAHISGDDYTLAGHIAVHDNETIQYAGRNEDNEFQFNVVSGSSTGNAPFSETIVRVNNETEAAVVCKKGGEKKGEMIVIFQ